MIGFLTFFFLVINDTIVIKGKDNIFYQLYLIDKKLYFYYKYKKFTSKPILIDSNVSSPAIAITPGDYIHIVWEKGGRIYYKTTLERVYPHLIRRGVPIVWSDTVRVSTPIMPITEPASNPFVEAQGEYVYVVWRGPNEEGNQNFGEIWQRVGRIQPGSTPQWRSPENKSKSPYRESNYPQMSTGSICVYQESLPNNNEVYANVSFLRPETINISRTERNSFFPHCNVLPTPLYWHLFTIWTEEIIPNRIYKIKNKKQSFFILPPVEPGVALDIVVGQPEPSFYCLKRDGYNNFATYPYDYGKELIYKIPYLHPEKYYSISLIFYLETFGQGSQSENKAEVLINDQIIDTISFLPFVPETCNFEIPYGLYESTFVILKIRNIRDSHCGISGIKVYEYEKIEEKSGGSQNLSSLLIKDFILYLYPNPAKNNLFIKYQLPKESEISISLYDILGKEIKGLKEKKKKGIYEVKFNIKELPSGVYFIHLKADNLKEAKKVIITR